jgi:hypothetical protein
MFCGGIQTDKTRNLDKILQKYTDAEVIKFSAAEQIKFVEGYLKANHPDSVIISLDKWFVGDFQVNISRVFRENSLQGKPQGFSFENRYKFEKYLKSVYKKKQSIVFVDDDIASGITMRTLTALVSMDFGSHFSIKGLSMAELYNPHQGRQILDIVDTRDFIEGAQFGGLLCEGGRVLYKHPNVNLVSRMKLTEENAINFTKEFYGS